MLGGLLLSRAGFQRGCAVAGVALASTQIPEEKQKKSGEGSIFSRGCSLCEGPLRRKLTPVGRFSLLSETASNPSITGVLLKLEGPRLAREDLEARLDRSFCGSSPRFQALVDQETLEFVSQDPPDKFSAKTQLTVLSSSSSSDEEIVGRLLAAPLDPLKPQWSATLWHVGEEPRVLIRTHHALADGVSMAGLLTSCTDQSGELAEILNAKIAERRQKKKRKHGWLAKLVKVFGLGFILLRALLLAGRERLIRSMFADSLLVLDQKGRSKRPLAWAADFADVAELKRVAKALGGRRATVNDLYAAIVAAAFQTYAQDKQESVAYSKIAAAIPIHLYGGVLPPGVAVGNHIGAVVVQVPLPVVGAPSSSHVALVSREVGGSLRGGGAAMVSYAAAYAAASLLPRESLPAALAAATTKVAVAMTNVRGPPLGLSIGGRRVVETVPFLPPPTGVPVGVALVTLNGKATLSVNATENTALDARVFLTIALDHFATLQRDAAHLLELHQQQHQQNQPPPKQHHE